MIDFRQYAPATERNRQPILDVLKRTLPAEGTVLEISSGTGEHITFFAPRLSHLQWLPSEPQPLSRKSIQSWGEALPSHNLLLPPLDLDVSAQPWPTVENISAIININMIHIAPWEMCEHLMAGAEKTLPKEGVLYLYGPYKRQGERTAPSNESFDAMLRDRNPSWGIRDLEAVVETASQHSLKLKQVIEMPANNFSVVFQRAA
ncbi:MAG: DUF938 domain-containing protein [Phormidesmis sp.]